MVADGARSVEIDGVEKVLDILWVHLDSEVTDALFEFWVVEATRSVIVHDFELTSQTDDSITASSLEGLPESLNKHGLESGNRSLALNLEAMSWLGLLALQLADLGWESNGTWQLLFSAVHGANFVASEG